MGASYSYDRGARLALLRYRTLVIANTGDVIYEALLRARRIRPDFAYHEMTGGTVDIVDQHRPSGPMRLPPSSVSPAADRMADE